MPLAGSCAAAPGPETDGEAFREGALCKPLPAPLDFGLGTAKPPCVEKDERYTKPPVTYLGT